jgi:hypothetical protein
MPPTTAASEGWIGSRRFDLVYFFGAALFSVLLSLSLLFFPVILVPVWWLWLWLGDGPHLWATYTRTYLDPIQRAKHHKLLQFSLLWFLPGILAWGATLFGIRELFDLYLFTALLWSTHHAVRQDYGILSIYQRYANVDDRVRRLDAQFLYVFFWGISGLFWFTHPLGRVAMMLPPRFPVWAEGVLWGAKVALLGVGLFYLWQTLQRLRRNIAPWPALFLVCQLGALTFAYFVLGHFEPLYPNAQDPEQFFFAVTVTAGVLHSIQYLAIVFVVNQRRHTTGEAWIAKMSRQPGKLYIFCLVGSLLYVMLLASRGNSPGFNFFALNSDAARLFLALYWGLFFHHYYIDQKIWRPHLDPQLRIELGLIARPSQENP